MSSLGSYITGEYEVLLCIFSFLDSKSLHSASKVCREWNKVARRIILKRNRPFGHFKFYNGKKWTKDCFDVLSQPKVILHFTSSRGAKNLGSELYPFLNELYAMDDVSVYKIRNEYFIASDFMDHSALVIPRLGKNDQGCLMLCDMPGVTVNSTCIHSEIEFDEMIGPYMEANHPKCALVISGGCETACDLANYIINSFSKVPRMIVAGGIAEHPIKERFLKKAKPRSCLCLTFHGENVTAHSALYELGGCVEKRIQELATEVGPIPPGGYRIAFIFSCINLLCMMGDRAIGSFVKHFPNVPLYGLWSYGEYMAVSPDTTPSDVEYMNEDWIRSECTSYLILTIKKDGQ